MCRQSSCYVDVSVSVGVRDSVSVSIRVCSRIVLRVRLILRSIRVCSITCPCDPVTLPFE